MNDRGRFADVVSANVYAWLAYRLMRALRDVSPALTRQTLQDLGEELEGGEFAEWAWEYACTSGYDPDAWVEQSRAARAARAAGTSKNELGPAEPDRLGGAPDQGSAQGEAAEARTDTDV